MAYELFVCSQLIHLTMKQVFIEPFAKSKPTGRKLLVLMMILQTLMALNYNAIPLLFFRPLFYCNTPDGPIQCHQIQACQEQPVKYHSDFSFTSVSMDFKLYCSEKKDEATVLTFMMLGHLVGAFSCSWLSDYGHSQRHVFIILTLAALGSGVALILASLSSTIFKVGVLFTLWSYFSEVLLTFECVMPALFFPKSMVKRAFALLSMSWSIYPTLMPMMFAIHKSWRFGVCFTMGVPLLLVCWYIYANFEELTHADTQQDLTESLTPIDLERVEGEHEPAIDVTHHQTEKVAYTDLWNSRHFRNLAFYFFVYGGSYVAAMTSLLTIGTLTGNVYVNLTIISAIEFFLSLTGSYISHHLNVRSTLKNIYLTMGISYLLYSFLPPSLKFFVIVEGKLLTDITWVLLGSYLYTISPTRFLPLVYSTRAIFNIFVSSVMPYIKYYFELARISIFVFSGTYEMFSYLSLRSIKEIDLSL